MLAHDPVDRSEAQARAARFGREERLKEWQALQEAHEKYWEEYYQCERITAKAKQEKEEKAAKEKLLKEAESKKDDEEKPMPLDRKDHEESNPPLEVCKVQHTRLSIIHPIL